MSETTQTVETGQNTPISSSIINNAIEAVMDMIDALGNYANITRGALTTGASISCEISPYTPLTVFLDKNSYHELTLVINAKNADLMVLSDTLNNITDSLSRKKSYTSGNGWQIVDISCGTMPRVIGREDNNLWLMSCGIVVKIFRKEDNANV